MLASWNILHLEYLFSIWELCPKWMPPTSEGRPGGHCVSQSLPFSTGSDREGENGGGPEAQGYWVGQAALALWAGSGMMSAEIRENLEYSSTQRGLCEPGETHAMIKHSHQEVNKEALDCMIATAICGGDRRGLRGNYSNGTRQGWSPLWHAWGCLSPCWITKLFQVSIPL